MSIHDAVCTNDVPALRTVIVGGADVDGVQRNGETALRYVALKGHVGCAKVLLEAKANVGKVDGDGRTPLHYASLNGHVECVRVRFAGLGVMLLPTYLAVSSSLNARQISSL